MRLHSSSSSSSSSSSALTAAAAFAAKRATAYRGECEWVDLAAFHTLEFTDVVWTRVAAYPWWPGVAVVEREIGGRLAGAAQVCERGVGDIFNV